LPNLAAFTPPNRLISLFLNGLLPQLRRAFHANRFIKNSAPQSQNWQYRFSGIRCGFMRAGAVCAQPFRHLLQLFSVRGQPARVALRLQ
jgi:hypothetical protein